MNTRGPHCHSTFEWDNQNTIDQNPACPACGNVVDFQSADQTIDHDASQPKQVGHFELIEKVGARAFGAVWKARDTELDRIVAIKIPRKGELAAEEIERFLREARAAAHPAHPHIVAVHEFGRADETVDIVSDSTKVRPWPIGGQQSDWGMRAAAKI